MEVIRQDRGLGITGFAAKCRSNVAEATVRVWALILLNLLILLASAIIRV